ncbi:MAG: N-acetylmuramoyl-L-alanine amidase [Brevibacterium sp.]|uniref:N-acetylmuramoyl-L-alanine amidase n=1 Tax=Brevibacterium sp. TaxID=1701 RepID=UPI003F8E63E8
MKPLPFLASALTGILLTATLSGPALAATPETHTNTPGASAAGGTPSERTVDAQTDEVTTLPVDSSDVTIIGATWEGDDPELEIRTRDGNGWSAWESLPTDDGGGPDAVSAEAAQIPAASHQSQSVALPVLDSDTVEVRAADKQADTDDLQITQVSTAVTKADAQVANSAGGVSTHSATGPAVDAQISAKDLRAKIVTRKQWGADEKLVRCATDKTSSAKGVFIHHTAGSNSYSKAQAPAIIRGYLAFHTQNRGWCDLGYNFLVDKYGTMYEGRAGSLDKAVTGAHASGFNSWTIGISVLGTYSSAAPSSAAQTSVKRLVAWKAGQYGFNPTGKMTLTSGGGGTSKYALGKKVSLNVVAGHRDTSYTECPGLAFYNKLGSIRTGAKALVPELTPPPTKAPTKTPAPKPKTYPTKGAIGSYYQKNAGKTGKPVGSEKKLKNPNGAYQSFAKGTVYWSKSTGAHFLTKGQIRVAYKRVKYEKGVLGFPSNDKQTFKYRKSARYQRFHSGMITWSPQTGSDVIYGGFLTKWKKMGYECSTLGLPTADRTVKNGVKRQNFERGYMTYTKKTGIKVHIRR